VAEQHGLLNEDGDLVWWIWPTLAAFYFCNYLVIIFFNAALVSCALLRLNGQEATVEDGIQTALGRLPQILMWAGISATVGLLLKSIEKSNDRMGHFIASLLGAAWTGLTFFVIPVMILEKSGPIQSIGRSFEITRKTWGEGVLGNFGIGFVMALLSLPAILMLVAAPVCFQEQELAFLGIFLVLSALVYFLGLSIVGATMGTVFRTALYLYAITGKIPTGYQQPELRTLFPVVKDTHVPCTAPLS
jgi:hypothetical protein